MEAVEASMVFTWDAEIFQVPLERNEDQPSSQLGGKSSTDGDVMGGGYLEKPKLRWVSGSV